jgi:hypothetical protein
MSDDIQRTLGDHGAKLRNLESQLSAVAQDVKSLVASENKRDGGKKIVWTVAAALGALSGGVADAFVTKWLK